MIQPPGFCFKSAAPSDGDAKSSSSWQLLSLAAHITHAFPHKACIVIAAAMSTIVRLQSVILVGIFGRYFPIEISPSCGRLERRLSYDLVEVSSRLLSVTKWSW